MRIPALIALSLCVFWPVTIWYFERVFDKSDEPLGVVSLIAFVAILITRKSTATPAARAYKVPLASIGCICLYIATWVVAPKLLSAIFALCAVGFLLDSFGGRFKMNLGTWLLLIFSLPLVSSLNFYSGYPLRMLVGKIAAPMLSMTGFPTVADGTALVWSGHAVQIDAPCGGIKMLWFSLFIAAVLIAAFDLKSKKAMLLFSISISSALLANVLRITSLFFVEAGIMPVVESLDTFVHQMIGMVSFAMSAWITVFAGLKLGLPSDGAVAEEFVQDASDSNLNEAFESSISTPFVWSYRARALCALAVVAALAPTMISRHSAAAASTSFPGWPAEFNNASFVEVPGNKADEAFYREFPGRIQCFTHGKDRVILRWVSQPTRQLHPSSDCFRGIGYHIAHKPMITDANGTWARFSAEKGMQKLSVRERIYDEHGGNWTDISSWYWAALMGKTQGPWWSVVIVSGEK